MIETSTININPTDRDLAGAINAAADVASLGQGKITIGPGTYLLDSPINLRHLHVDASCATIIGGTGSKSAQATIMRAAIDAGARYASFKMTGSFRQHELQTARAATLYLYSSQISPFIGT